MYRSFRERILRLCPRLYDDLCPLEILSLMRIIAFPPESSTLQSIRLSLRISLYTTRQTTAPSGSLTDAISIVSGFVATFRSMPARRTSPTPRPASTTARQSCDHWGFIRASPRRRGCFLIPGRISPSLPEHLLHTKVVLSESVIFEAKLKLSSHMLTQDLLFPDLDAIAAEVTSFSTSSNPDFADAQDAPDVFPDTGAD